MQHIGTLAQNGEATFNNCTGVEKSPEIWFLECHSELQIFDVILGLLYLKGRCRWPWSHLHDAARCAGPLTQRTQARCTAKSTYEEGLGGCCGLRCEYQVAMGLCSCSLWNLTWALLPSLESESLLRLFHGHSTTPHHPNHPSAPQTDANGISLLAICGTDQARRPQTAGGMWTSTQFLSESWPDRINKTIPREREREHLEGGPWAEADAPFGPLGCFARRRSPRLPGRRAALDALCACESSRVTPHYALALCVPSLTRPSRGASRRTSEP